MGRERGRETARLLAASERQEVRQQRVAGRREYRLRVELDSPGGHCSVPQRHERSIRCPGQRNEFRREGFGVDDQRVVSGHHQRRGKPREQVDAFMLNGADLSVDRSSPDHPTAERLTQALVSQADAEDRNPPADESREIDTDSGLTGSTRSGGKDYLAGPERHGGLEIDRIVANHDRLLSQFLEVACEVVDEGVVVVDE